MQPRPAPLGRQQRAFSIWVAAFGVLALLVPLWPELAPERRLGTLLIAAAAIEWYHGLRRAQPRERREAWTGGAVTFVMGLLLLNAPLLVGRAVVLLTAGWFAFDAARYLLEALGKRRRRESALWALGAAAGNLAVLLILVLLGGSGVLWVLAIAAAVRIFGTAANILHASVHSYQDAGDTVLRDLGLPERPELAALGDRIEAEELARRRIDRYWIWTFILTLFAIHLGRMGFDRTALGIVAPGFAVFGDLVVALLIGLGIVLPTNLLLRQPLGRVERLGWTWCLDPARQANRPSWQSKLVRAWLTRRLRYAVRLRQARYSFWTAIGRGLQSGLPAAAMLAATTPIWGMSWYFDTENYASGIWNSWAEARTDSWREAMAQAVTTRATEAGRPAPTFAIQPPGLDPGGDFAFIVIGDTGEGDASQHILRDQLLLAAGQPDVRFVVISSDVVYPNGEMKDYEARFWLPFKGVQKPVYAIPGNHDWYDALEAFAATFLDRESARVSMRARAEADLKLTTTNERKIDRLLEEADRLRLEYGVPTGFQQAPFFQFQTPNFAFFAVDTGVRKRLDEVQLAWFKTALESARGKFKMALLGHPLYACGTYRAAGNEDFAALHELLHHHGVQVVMAGDTHDLEYYRESLPDAGTTGRVQHHFVNGGGGAYLTMGVQFAAPDKMPTSTWAFYPAKAPLVAKIEARNPFWKRPMWWWTRDLGAWPSSPEWLSAAFDYNVAPYFQSFFEVRVEPSTRQIRLRPWGVKGRLRWSDLQRSADLPSEGTAENGLVEWAFPFPEAAPGT